MSVVLVTMATQNKRAAPDSHHPTSKLVVEQPDNRNKTNIRHFIIKQTLVGVRVANNNIVSICHLNSVILGQRVNKA